MRLDSLEQRNCEETAGFLFSHRCGRRAVAKCDATGILVCSQHAHPFPWSVLDDEGIALGDKSGRAAVAEVCTKVAKRLREKRRRDADAGDDAGDVGASKAGIAGSRHRDDSPFFYGAYWWHHGYPVSTDTCSYDDDGDSFFAADDVGGASAGGATRFESDPSGS